MTSAKYLGYVGGAAVALGVGAALATASEGTAHADTETKSVTSESKGPEKKNPAAKLEKRLTKVAQTVATASKAKPKFDTADAVKKLQQQFTPPKVADKPVQKPASNLAGKAAETAEALAKMPTPKIEAAAEAPAWNPNPFRADDPAPNDMPAAVAGIQQAVVGAFDQAPIVQPVVREGFEAGYRVSQMIPWVNVVVPATNIVQDLPNLAAGDKDATQRIINNLLVTTQPVSLAFYGYDQIADVLNVEAPAQDLKVGFYATAWNALDWFELLHNSGESGLPLSPSPSVSGANARAVAFALAEPTDDPLTNPFRESDPWPTDMPDALLDIEKATVAALNATALAPLSPFYREGFEAVYRFSQTVPYVNAPIPLAAIVASLFDADKSVPQTLINQLLLTTQPVSLLYYGYDEIADLANVEVAAYELKQQLYRTIWDGLDPLGLLNPLGDPGI